MLYTTLNEVKETAGFVSFGTSTTSLAILREDIILAEKQLVRQYIGKDLYNDLAAKVNTGSIVADSDDDVLLTHIRRYVSHKALHTGASKINVNLEKSGIHSNTTDTQKPVREWMLTQLKEQLLEDACTHLDALLAYLEENKADLPLWTDSDQYASYRKHIIQSIDVFQKYYYLNDSYSTLMAMSGVMGHVEEVMMRKALGSDFYEAILVEVTSGTVTEDTQTLLDRYLYRIVAYYAVARAMRTMAVSLEQGGIKINEYVAGESSKNKRIADIKERELLYLQLEQDAGDALLDMAAFLNEEAAVDKYAEWYSGTQYEAPLAEGEEEEEEEDVNDSTGGFYMV